MSPVDPDRAARGTWGATIYPGADAVKKRLKSCGLVASKVTMYQGGRGSIWEATTDKGLRWVTWNGGAWTVAKVPPARKGRA